jgi:hypothetical protein
LPSGSSKAPCWRWEEPAYQPVTIDLHRLWKGNVPRRATVYAVRDSESRNSTSVTALSFSRRLASVPTTPSRFRRQTIRRLWPCCSVAARGPLIAASRVNSIVRAVCSANSLASVFWRVTRRIGQDDTHGAALPELASRSPRCVRGGDDRWTRTGSVRARARGSRVPDWYVDDSGYSG